MLMERKKIFQIPDDMECYLAIKNLPDSPPTGSLEHFILSRQKKAGIDKFTQTAIWEIERGLEEKEKRETLPETNQQSMPESHD